jgi:hypothetical protein
MKCDRYVSTRPVEASEHVCDLLVVDPLGFEHRKL